MDLYLSSYKLGDETETLKELAAGKRIGYIPNALDHVDEPARSQSNVRDMDLLRELGISVELLDLRDYFGDTDALEEKLPRIGGVWVRGGNTFILRAAMRLSGFDVLMRERLVGRDDFLYGGYSAGICVLAPSLAGIARVDDPDCIVYEQISAPIWDGLGVLDYLILPHYDSDHPESADVDREVEYCRQNNIAFRTLRDGEVIILRDKK